MRHDVPVFTDYPHFTDPRRNAKIYKVLSHLYIDTSWSIWVDGNIKLTKDPSWYIEQVDNAGKEIGAFSHWERTCVYQEAVVCQQFDKEAINEQMERYRKEGYGENQGLWMCGILIRKNTETINRLNEKWWAEICRGSYRDQLSFPYVFKDHVHTIAKGNHLQNNEYFTVK